MNLDYYYVENILRNLRLDVIFIPFKISFYPILDNLVLILNVP